MKSRRSMGNKEVALVGKLQLVQPQAFICGTLAVPLDMGDHHHHLFIQDCNSAMTVLHDRWLPWLQWCGLRTVSYLFLRHAATEWPWWMLRGQQSLLCTDKRVWLLLWTLQVQQSIVQALADGHRSQQANAGGVTEPFWPLHWCDSKCVHMFGES